VCNVKVWVLASVLMLLSFVPLQTIAMLKPEPNVSLAGIEGNGTPIPNSVLYTLNSSHYQLFPLSSENRPFPVWGELIRDLDHEAEKTYLTQTLIDPVFAFRFDIVFWCMNKNLFVHTQIPDPSYMLVLSREANFKLTKQSLRNLRSEGLPDDILKDLELLAEQGFTKENKFLHAIEEQIGKDYAVRYEDLILKYASIDTPAIPIGLVRVSKGTDFWDITSDSQENIEAWDMVFYYPKKIKEKISHNDEKKPEGNSTMPSDDEGDFFFDILEFFKKWGVPKPLTIVLGIVAIYLVLAFLTRNR
jgi:hypothetical protein